MPFYVIVGQASQAPLAIDKVFSLSEGKLLAPSKVAPYQENRSMLTFEGDLSDIIKFTDRLRIEDPSFIRDLFQLGVCDIFSFNPPYSLLLNSKLPIVQQ